MQRGKAAFSGRQGTKFQFSQSLIATKSWYTRTVCSASFQFSQSLIATTTHHNTHNTTPKVSILPESYCNITIFKASSNCSFVSILPESYCNRENGIWLSIELGSFNSPRVLLQHRRIQTNKKPRDGFNSPRVLLQRTAPGSTLPNSSLFQFSQSLIATCKSLPPNSKTCPVSILPESYCN